MASLDEAAFTEILEQEVKGLTRYLVDEDYDNAIRDAQTETGFSLPLDSASYQLFWLKKRAKRHLFFYLYSESAHKFKIDQINLQHRFAHYDKMLKRLDEEFAEEIEANPHMFSNVSPFHMFGSKVDAGFSYDDLGDDTTYDVDQLVIVSPSSNE